MERILRQQSERIEQLETAQDLREEYENHHPEEYRQQVERLKSLRAETEDLLGEIMDELDKEIDSVDQNLQVMDRYEQEKGESYYLDETI